MVVVDHKLGVHKEIDMVTTPIGAPVAMVHCNNCTSDINAWVELFSQFAAAMGMDAEKGTIFSLLFNMALEGDPDCGDLVSFNYYSGDLCGRGWNSWRSCRYRRHPPEEP